MTSDRRLHTRRRWRGAVAGHSLVFDDDRRSAEIHMIAVDPAAPQVWYAKMLR